MITNLAGGPHETLAATPYSEEVAVGYPITDRASLWRSAAIGPTPVSAGAVTRMTLDGHSRCALRRNGGAPPPRAGPSRPCRASPKIWGF